MGYQFRYMPAFEFARQAVRDGLLGELFFFRARISKAKSVYEQLLPELSHYQGGNFFELGCHILDMGIVLMGAPQRVQRVLRTDYGPNPRFADNTVAVVEFAGGIGVFETSAMEVDPKRRIELYGTQGSIIMHSIMPNEVDLCLESAHAPYAAGWQTVPVDDRLMFSQDIAEFAAVIAGEKQPEYSAEQTLQTQQTLLEICQEA
jgi:predicted dehydrogenase